MTSVVLFYSLILMVVLVLILYSFFFFFFSSRRRHTRFDCDWSSDVCSSDLILAHPRGRISGSRAGVIANWDTVFEAAAQRGVAIEIDGDPARQDLDFMLGRRASAFGCIFALDSDAHTTGQLSYSETALAHARLAPIPANKIVNCWPLERLLAWLSDPSSECHR